MATPKPRVSCSAAVPSEESSVVQVLDSNEPLVASSSSGPPCVQVLDSSEPLVFASSEPVAGSSRVTVPSTLSVLPASRTSSESSVGDAEPRASGSLGRRVHDYSEEIRSQWNMFKIITQLNTPAQCIAFAEEHGLLPTEKMCTYHKRPMSLSSCNGTGQLGIFRCRKSNCRSRAVSRSAGTWFENMRVPIDLQFLLMYMYSHKYSYQQIKLEAAREDEAVLSTSTIADWFSYCRETVVIYELEHQEYNGKIGGPGKIVQIEEFKFGKRKYNRGKHIEGHWLLGMIENGKNNLRLEVCPDNDRSAETLVPLILKHVEVGTEIHTDFWKAYDCLPQYGYIHKKVNHSDPKNELVAPDGGHTQRTESHWRNLKVMFSRDGNKENFTHRLVEYSWRRKIKITHKDVFLELIKAIKYVYKIER